MFRHPEGLIQDRMQRIDELMERMKSRFEHDISLRSEKLHGLGGKLDALGPMSVIKRGYSVILDEEGQIVRCVADVAPKDRIRCVVSDGEFKAEVS
jgi:exodeoxyribonuclease VII large subunit